ncbi:helix-turn-helix domain-containing protein [Halococcoides cellulosivorans]|uniref:Helix-turn-helix domain-containing protein n=1 Tax=Halococcoides cellulosivorans TaxID=1679096 RepID=A0A2R4X3F6_9EURY|nr:helix-turn-helix domain-containing protein [Halococcoides cellulosivorans]AWB28324.1 helix-turn-helix domain-containing protein [Halococcoides cellulosivorans]
MIAEFDIDTTVMDAAFDRSPQMEASLLQQTASASNGLDVVMDVVDEEFSSFESGLDADDTVTDWVRLSGADDWRRYRVTLTEQGRRLMTHPRWADESAVFLDGTRTRDCWRFRIQFPDENSFQRYVEYCDEHPVTFRPTRLSRTDPATASERFGLTPGQRQLLSDAQERGFFEVPRECTLEELAVDAPVSHQALSERLRRGMGSLVESTLR